MVSLRVLTARRDDAKERKGFFVSDKKGGLIKIKIIPTFLQQNVSNYRDNQMTNTMKRLFFLIAVSCTIFSCSDDNEPSNNGIDRDQIVGEWKLIYFHDHSWDSYVFDFRKKNIVYDYRPNGILVVNGDGDPNVPHTDGQHNYSFVKETVSEQRDEQLIVNIDNEKWTYAFSDGQMTISLAYVDGGTLTFTRK